MKVIKKKYKIIFTFVAVIFILMILIFISNRVVYKTTIHHGMGTFSKKHNSIAEHISSWQFYGGFDPTDLKKIIESKDGEFKIGKGVNSLIHRLNDITNLYIPYATGNQAVVDPKVLSVIVKNNVAYVYIMKPREGMSTMIDSWIIEISTTKEIDNVVVVDLF